MLFIYAHLPTLGNFRVMLALETIPNVKFFLWIFNALTNTALNSQSHCDRICTNVTQVNIKHRKQNHSHSFRWLPYHTKTSLPSETPAGLQFTAAILKQGMCFSGRYAAAEEPRVKQEDVNWGQRAANLSYVITIEGRWKLMVGFNSQ